MLIRSISFALLVCLCVCVFFRLFLKSLQNADVGIGTCLASVGYSHLATLPTWLTLAYLVLFRSFTPWPWPWALLA